jgi:Zn finger protein HypA/HybF involved in hydrogenase expression
MSSNDREFWATDPRYAQRVDETIAAATARVNAAADAAASPAGIIAENAIRRQKINQEIDKIVCPDCKRTARMLEDQNYKCPKCRNSQWDINDEVLLQLSQSNPKKYFQIMKARTQGGVAQGGSKRKSKSHRRKKSKSQRRKKSIKRRH